MKKIFSFVLILAIVFLSGCTEEYNDSLLNEKVSDLEKRVAYLEQLCKQMNTNITSLQSIVSVMEENDYVASVTPIIYDSEEIGYTISFKKNKPITIYHGVKGNDGASPIIGIKQDTNGDYYWTLDGEWLTDNKGLKIGANGADGSKGEQGDSGVTPKLKIENGNWYVSNDGGATWNKLGQATGEKGEQGDDGLDGSDGSDGLDGDSMFSDIDYSNDDYVLFTLSDGTQIKLPTWYAFEQLQEFCNQMNTNISTLQGVVTALQDNDYIKSITPILDNGVEIGYTIAFSKNNPLTIYHGNNGEDGYSPKIGVKQDIDGNYYWTLDEEWLLDDKGQKNKANAKDGITPVLKIENGSWHVSYDNGNTWNNIGQATGDKGDNVFSSVTQDEKNVYFTLVDNTVITISKNLNSKEFIQFEDVEVKRICLNWDTNYDGEISYEEAAAVTSLGTVFQKSNINLFRELKYFTNLTSIESVFVDCAKLAYIELPDNVTNLEKAFYNCKKLRSVVVPNGVTNLDYAFYNCSSLEVANISKSSESLLYSFYGCSKLKSDMFIPKTVTNMDIAFQNCSSLKKVTFEKGINLDRISSIIVNSNRFPTDAVAGTFKNCSSLLEIYIPASVKAIDYCAFEKCTSLSIVSFEEKSKLEQIYGCYFDGINDRKWGSFINCNNLNVFDASNCKIAFSLEDYSFENCTALKTIKLGSSSVCYGSLNLFKKYILGNYYYLQEVNLQVPKECIEDYKTHNTWQYYTITELE